MKRIAYDKADPIRLEKRDNGYALILGVGHELVADQFGYHSPREWIEIDLPWYGVQQLHDTCERTLGDSGR